MKTTTFIDLFAGIGGFRLGIENAAKKLQIPVKCVFSSEIEKNAVKIYEKNFNETPHGDIKKIQATDIPYFDIICGGFPCQPFSNFGKQEGFCDPRGELFFEIARIIRAKKPKILFLENVKNLLGHDRGRTFAKILITLDELGYDVEWQCIDTAHYLPQHRERVFIIGHHRKEPTPSIFPIIPKTNRIRNESSKSEKGICEIASTLTKRAYGSWNGNYIMIDDKLRFITPLECEKLQGFPSAWTECIEDKYRYECLGNAVTVNVIEAIAEKLLCAVNKVDPTEKET